MFSKCISEIANLKNTHTATYSNIKLITNVFATIHLLQCNIAI